MAAPSPDREFIRARSAEPVVGLVAVLPSQMATKHILVVEVDLAPLSDVHVREQKVVAFAEDFLRSQFERIISLPGAAVAELRQRRVLRVGHQ